MWSTSDFELGPLVGSGTFGHARLARERRGGCVVVLKVLRKKRMQRLKLQRHLGHEIEIQAHLRHPNILRLRGFFWDATQIYMILDRARGGDLYSHLQKQPTKRLVERDVALCLSQVSAAIAYCRKMSVIHRDVKPHNILITRGLSSLKLGDFGWAVHTRPDERRWTLCGTLDYMAPEMVLNATRGHSFGVDVWGLGVLAYELATGQAPFWARSHDATCRLILNASPKFTGDAEALSLHARDFIECCLRRDSADRMSVEDAGQHLWFAPLTSGISLRPEDPRGTVRGDRACPIERCTTFAGG